MGALGIAMTSPTALKKRSVNIAGHCDLGDAGTGLLAGAEGYRGKDGSTSVAALIAEIDRARGEDPSAPNLSSAIRVFVLSEVKPAGALSCSSLLCRHSCARLGLAGRRRQGSSAGAAAP